MPETLIIGAGAAGIAAARTLHDAGREVLLIEAADRIGGRAHSIVLDLPRGGRVTVDAGCGWLHSARRNPWTGIAEREGFTIDRTDPGWDAQWRDLGWPPAEQQAFGEASARWEAAAHAALGGPDRPVSDFVAADDPARPLLDAISGYVSGAPLARVSLHDWAAYDRTATEDNWAVREGYGTLVAHHAAGVPVRLGVRATRVDHRGRVIRVETDRGTIDADRVVIAVPTGVLAEGALTFDPPLPAKQEAAAGLPLGLADKVFLGVDDPPWPAHAHLLGQPRSSRTGSYRLSPFGRPIVEAFFGGEGAEALDEGGAAAAFAVDELVALLGSGWRSRLHPLHSTRWRQVAGVGGSYSYARVGHAGARAALAAPVDERVFFAGEACSAGDFSTAHGAFSTGVAAAEAILAQRDG